ncbi:hypothetical protein AJ78_07261 [Emergomyces pasteurianus Ep9510]|uniref:Uncharacterized protein n=1 Tax=Emergomyces pasteurianus Ep9510 TaxID=1447872 RepID=A0A1J9Q819_9EURO|nr:hypothetical protein AJ78_07261 [Emergomyces pasteurianus Ep9510]
MESSKSRAAQAPGGSERTYSTPKGPTRDAARYGRTGGKCVAIFGVKGGQFRPSQHKWFLLSSTINQPPPPQDPGKISQTVGQQVGVILFFQPSVGEHCSSSLINALDQQVPDTNHTVYNGLGSVRNDGNNMKALGGQNMITGGGVNIEGIGLERVDFNSSELDFAN